jgi:hypothetical protein
MDISYAVPFRSSDRESAEGQVGPFGVLGSVWVNFAISKRGRAGTPDGAWSIVAEVQLPQLNHSHAKASQRSVIALPVPSWAGYTINIFEFEFPTGTAVRPVFT